MSLTVENISHHFGATRAVRDASLNVGRGEIVSLFGHSGCGKTTLLRIIGGLEPLQSGIIKLGNSVLSANDNAVPPEKRPLGFVFQDFVLFPHLTVEKNIAFGIAGDKDRRERVSTQLSALGLDGLEKRYPHELSGGQQQRVALARALVREPEALLLDEPFSNIDATRRLSMREELRSILKAQNVAVILVTHDPDEAITMGDRIALMKNGEIIETGAPIDLFNAPKTIEGASIFPGCQRVEGVARSGRLITALGVLPAPGVADGAGVVVVRAGALSASVDPLGDFEVIDRRFTGGGWTALVASPETGLRLKIDDAQWMALGQRVQLSVDEEQCFLFPAD